MRKNNFILSAILSAAIFCLPSFLSAQAKPSSPELSSSAKVGSTEVSMKWGAPSVKGRAIWGELVPFDKIWRTGANNATTFTAAKDVKINGKALAAGTYSVFTIPGKTDWTLIFNKKAEQWGAYDYKDSDDALRVTVTPKMVADVTEQLTFTVNKNGKVSFQWEKLTFDFTVSSAK
ncbi:MAG: DUF2911 domain-containing protein [Saprospiraceae bacterium]|jgi:hypothetical protein|nr:DUF2911 domain-containing protein [Saprospiraceae bacterium]MCF8300918.1 DUF2911 domain-containing protein [Haliscomenobacter sp.]MCF8317924.1 DUF2911 domain-containing protein [Haliscomenobacter sp.]